MPEGTVDQSFLRLIEQAAPFDEFLYTDEPSEIEYQDWLMSEELFEEKTRED